MIKLADDSGLAD